MKKIILVGAGQLGSRYLQGLAKLNFPVSIDVVEPSSAAIETAKTRYDEIKNPSFERELNFFKSLDEIKKSYDLAIFTTNSDVRANLTKTLLNRSEVQKIIFEKVVFQRIKDFEEIGLLLDKHRIEAFVNFPRRAFPIFIKLKELIKKSEKVSFSVFGNNWGLACSCLHFFDTLAFLSGENDFEVDLSGLDKIVHPSRRENFIELTGEMRGTQPGGHKIFLYSQNVSPSPFVTHVFTESVNAVLDESTGLARISTLEKGWIWEETQHKLIYQSDLTPVIVTDIINNRTIPLTRYSQAFSIHRPVISSIQDFVEKISGKNYGYCPIT
ncbi:MAG: hypothetical protein HQM10_00970 [Candidatus Riflebacteria bacterium]|nr:hypothetical protein [Candidatus Riflebacteria bacterium]